MIVNDIKFDLDELKVFQSAMTDTPTARIIFQMLSNRFDYVKNELLHKQKNIEEIRYDQGVLRAMELITAEIRELLALDPDEIVDEEVENDELEEPNDPVNVNF